MSYDEIRAKRLAKLAAISRPNESPKATTGTGDQAPNKNEANIIKSDPEPQPSRKIAKPDPKIIETPKKEPNPVKKIEKSVEKVVGNGGDLKEQFNSWLSLELEETLQVTTNYTKRSNELVYLETLSSEINNRPQKSIIADDLESIFMEVLTELGIPTNYKSSIQYLHRVYEKSLKLKRMISKKDLNYDPKMNVVNSLINFSCSYGFICFQISDMFINNELPETVNYFINNVNTNNLNSFLVDIVNKSIENDGLLELLNILMPAISSQLYKLNLNDTAYNKYLSIIEILVNQKSVCSVFSEINGFQPPDANNCLDYEHKTLLGPILRLSPLIDKVAIYYFKDQTSTARIDYSSVQNEFKVVIDRLFFIIDKLVRGSGETRTQLLKWFGNLINLSHLRTGSHGDISKLPSDGIMFNISIILIKLSLPFLEYPTFSKIDKIDMNYLGGNLIDLKDESRVNSSIPEAKEYEESHQINANFISDCFYLTLTYLNYGIGGISTRYDRLKQQINQLKERIEMIERNQVPQGTNPMMITYLRNQLPQLNHQLSILQSTKHSIKALFDYRDIHVEVFDFILGSTIFLTRVIDPNHQYPQTKLKIPIFQIGKVSDLDDQDFLKTKCPSPWKYYPEFWLEGIINYCKFTTKFNGCPLINNYDKLSIFIEFTIILIRCPEILGNPHMKSNIIEILFIGSLPLSNGSPGFMSGIFNSNELVRDNILYSLLDLYVMVEKTGASSQFYDKFNSRYYISVILEELWKDNIYKKQLINYSVNNVDFFIRFIARMLNDTTYLLDETFNELNSIHKYQQELKKRQMNQPEDEEFGTTDELIKNLETSERRAKSYMGLSNKTMQLFKLFTKEVPKGFILPELIDRLSGMMNYNLEALVGPKCSNLKVEDPTKYDFDPRTTLKDLCEIYCNLSNETSFIKSVARDGRSYNIEWFRKAENILRSKTLTNPAIIDTLVEFANKAEQQRIEDENEELELGEVPEEFLDPLMFSLMEDPVILPSSKISIDRSTIKAHLLSDPTDPFNRVPLKLEDVVDDVELREKIRQFKAGSRET